ncbi:MAG: Gldg family protein [Patescibacteria group bacterium]|nr:Gldg family protein [Patescibacteria group bacterium]
MKNILIIIKKELRSHFNSPTAYIAIVAFLLLWEFLFFRGVFLVGQASLRSLFDFLPWIFLIFVPALTMGSIAQEKSQGTMEFLLTRPLKEIELIVGKFIGSFLFIAIALLFLFPVAWSLNKFGPVDWGVVFGQYLASLFLATTFVSLGIVISSIFKSQISALLTTSIAGFFLVIIGSDIATARLPLEAVPFMEYSSVLTHFGSMVRGVIDIRDVWYFISISIIFLSIAYLFILSTKFGSWKKIERNTQIGITLIIAIAIISNIATSRVNARIDLTEEKIYTLSASTKEILTNLDDLVDVTFYHSEQLPSQFQPVLRQIKDTLNDYESFSRGNIVISEKNPADDTKIATEATSSGIQEVRFNVVSQEEFQIKTGYLGIVVSYGGESEAIPFVENTSDLEYQLSSFITKLTIEEKPKIVFASTPNGKSSVKNFQLLARELENQYTVENLIFPATETTENENKVVTETPEKEKLEQTENFEIPEDTSVLVIAGPNKNINEDARTKIKNFSNGKGTVFFMIDGVEVISESFMANANPNSFSDFTSDEFGISVKKNMVYDLRSNETVSFTGGRMRYMLPYPFWVRSQRTEQTQIASKIESVLFPWASTVEIDEKKTKDLEITKLFSTTKAGSSQSGQFNLSPEQKFPSQGLESQLLAVAAKSSDTSEQNLRFVVVGDSDFLTDQFTQNNPQNLAFGVEIISWLAQAESLTDIRLKNISDRTMTFEDESQPNTIKFGNMAFALIVPATFGTIRMARRRRMKQLSYDQK